MSDTHKIITTFLSENFFVSEGDLRDDLSLTDSGTIDSTGVLELVIFLEETFALRIPDRDVVPDNLDTIGNMARYVETRQAA
jgi:acyl carrier protein